MGDDRPTCPDHPDSDVLSGHGVEDNQWICMTCGRKLGPAPYEPVIEEFEV